MRAIERGLIALRPDAVVTIQNFSGNFTDEILRFRPDVIVTFPMTSVGLSYHYYVFKHYLQCTVICLRAEGVVHFDNPKNVEAHIGYDKYGPRLVDFEVFWGKKPAHVIGRGLLNQGKLSSSGRIRYFGYPRLEKYFADTQAFDDELPARVKERLEKSDRQKTFLFVTGFHFANYSKKDLFAAGDLDAENRCDELLETVEAMKAFRQQWIDAVLKVAKKHDDALFVLKKHPIEKAGDYDALRRQRNVLYVDEEVNIADLLPYASLFLHYGSTALADAWLLQVPSVYVYSDNEKCRTACPDLGWPSTMTAHVAEVENAIADHAAGRIRFVMTEKMERILDENFNVQVSGAYSPSLEIAEFILECGRGQRVTLADRFLIKALAKHHYRVIKSRFGRTSVGKRLKEALEKKPVKPT